MSILYVFIYC